ncbi:MAG: sulfur oxidation c-type cytochrome SoxX [Burkholderiales bacterium]|nr:sulfur oxidation c-type cytochrome SoxX [Burkholderiales bacterium]
MNRAIVFAGLAAVVAGCAGMQGETAYHEQAVAMMKRDFHTRGIAQVDRLNQDELQRVCTQYGDHPPADVEKRLEAVEMASIKLPADGKYMGDWKRGQRIAADGRGMTWSDKPGVSGGSCYNCHQLSPRETSFGNVGPSLRAFGKTRGFTVENQKYVYQRVSNSKAFVLCSAMPRFGHSSTLTEEQIKDVVAYLMDPNSPVNQ